MRKRSARFTLEPEKLAQIHGLGIELDLDDAAARLAREPDIDADLTSLRSPMARFQLNVPDDAVGLDHDVVAALVDVVAQDLTVASTIPPEAAQKLADEQMLDDLFAGAGPRAVGGLGCNVDVRTALLDDAPLRSLALAPKFSRMRIEDTYYSC